MRWREFLAVLAGAAVGMPLAASGQQGDQVQRVGMPMSFPESDPEGQGYFTADRAPSRSSC
jgi:hypothetical protein